MRRIRPLALVAGLYASRTLRPSRAGGGQRCRNERLTSCMRPAPPLPWPEPSGFRTASGPRDTDALHAAQHRVPSIPTMGVQARAGEGDVAESIARSGIRAARTPAVMLTKWRFKMAALPAHALTRSPRRSGCSWPSSGSRTLAGGSCTAPEVALTSGTTCRIRDVVRARRLLDLSPGDRPRRAPRLDQFMGSVGSSDAAHHEAEVAVWFGGASLVWWFCCPFWGLVSFGALPSALIGLVRAWVEYRASRAGRAGGRRALVGGGGLCWGRRRRSPTWCSWPATRSFPPRVRRRRRARG